MNKMKKRILSLSLTLVIVLALIPATIADDSLSVNNYDCSSEYGFVPGEVLAPADSQEHAEKVAAAYGLELKSYAYGIAVLSASDPERAVERSRSARSRNGSVPSLSLNRTYELQRADTFPMTRGSNALDTYPHSGHHHGPSADPGWHHIEMDTRRAWEHSTGKGVVVAVIDSGIDIDHPAFRGRILSNSFNSHTLQVGLTHVRDDSGHGTEVAGAIAAATVGGNNVHGIAPDVELLIIKAFVGGNWHGTSDTWLRGINYAVENGVHIINMSFGRGHSGASSPDDLERSVITNAVNNGVTIIASAGNESGEVIHPAAYPEVIAVSATKQGFAFELWYSNYGSEIDVAAPGTDIYTTVIGGAYGFSFGTSMAAPNVAGVAALIKAQNPEYTPAQIRSVLQGTAMEAGTLGRDDYFGYGIVNAYAAVLGINALRSVSYNFNDGHRSAISARVVPGNRLIEPDDPTRENFAFDGWYTSATGGQRFSFSSAVNSNTTLYARWAALVPGMFAAEFPDPNFRREVLRLLNDMDGGRRTNSSIMSSNDNNRLASVRRLLVWNMNIHDMTGLSHFTGLTFLNGLGNQLTELDVSRLTSLITLDVGDNKLTRLNISKNTVLQELFFERNELRELDVSNNINLRSIIGYNNQLTALDVSKNTVLEELWVGDNRLMKLDVSNNTALRELQCRNNSLTELDISRNLLLQRLLVDGNQLATLDVSRHTALTELWCDENPLGVLDVKNNTKLEILCLNNIQITELDLSNNPALEVLWCVGNQLTTLDLTNNTVLQRAYVSNNLLTDLIIGRKPALTELYCGSNRLTSLDISTSPVLAYLDIGHNYLPNKSVIIGLDERRTVVVFDPQRIPVLTNSLSNFTRPNTYTPGTFTDIDNAWYTDWVKRAYEYGIMQGIGHNRFDPNGNLTGAQALTIGARIHSVYKYGNEGEAMIESFKRTGDRWYDMFVLYAKAEGLVGGEFDAKMDTPVTRAEMVFAWSKILEPKDMTTQNTVNSLPDMNANTQYRDAIMLFYRAGIVGGVDAAGTFRPNNNITRAEAATIFMRLVDADSRSEGRTFGG
jgi:uncharacterized repeat protein (TIGR02543 family)